MSRFIVGKLDWVFLGIFLIEGHRNRDFFLFGRLGSINGRLRKAHFYLDIPERTTIDTLYYDNECSARHVVRAHRSRKYLLNPSILRA
jgi:hypothetical protein